MAFVGSSAPLISVATASSSSSAPASSGGSSTSLSSSPSAHLHHLALQMHTHVLARFPTSLRENTNHLCTSSQAVSSPFVGTRICASLEHGRNTQYWVCHACRPEVNQDFLNILSSQTDSFHVVCHHFCSICCPQDNSAGRSNGRFRKVMFAAHVFGGSTVRQDFCPIELLLCWVGLILKGHDPTFTPVQSRR